MRTIANSDIDVNYPSIEMLRKKARKRIPKFAFQYLDEGCNENINLHRNTADIRDVQLIPNYLKPYEKSDLSATLFGETYDAPFGISPMGLQGLIYPNACEALAKASVKYNVPFILSTVSTASIEKISEITGGKAWFQLYNPAEPEIRNDILKRLSIAGYDKLVVICDVPTFGYRPAEMKNGLSMPPRMTLSNILQMLTKPVWGLQTLRYGIPHFASLKKYMNKRMSLKSLGQFMDSTFSKRISDDKIKEIRDNWDGKLILKGVASLHDAQAAKEMGFDGIIVSNHGGRQLDAGQSSIKPMMEISKIMKGQIAIMMDSGIRSGPDIARCLAAGADFTFLGRSFMYGIGALGNRGGNHTIAILKRQFQQVMEQICCEHVDSLPEFLARN